MSQTSSGAPLASSKVLDIMRKSLDESADESSTIKNPCEAFALLAHSCMLAVDFCLVGLSEDDRIESQIELSTLSPLPSTWKSSSSYGFRYKHNQSSMQYLLKVHRLGGKTIVTGLGLGDDKTATYEITTKDFFSESFFPYNVKGSQDDKTLEQGFISSSRLTDLINEFKVQIIQKLIPGLHKPGYEETKTTTQTSQSSQQASIRDPLRADGPSRMPEHLTYDPLRYPPRYPQPVPGGDVPPGWEDEYDMNRGPRPMPGFPGGRLPFDIGSDDLNPPGLGRNPALTGPFFGGGGSNGGIPGFGGTGEFGGPGGGGMYPTGSHPMFGNRGQQGSGQSDPRFPAGARYDPTGPGDFNGLPRPGRGGGGGFGGFGSGDFI